jgi:Na+/H+ antiporter NhaC
LAEQKRLEEIAKEKELKEQESIKKAAEKVETEKVEEKNNEKKAYFIFPIAILIVVLTITFVYKKRVIKL